MPAEPPALVHRTLSARAGTSPHPCLLIMHGRGADEMDLLPLAEQLDPRLYAVSVRAPNAFGWGGYHWYEMSERGAPDAASLAASVERVERFLDELPERCPIDPARIFLLGFSQGAMMAGTLTLRRPARFAGTIMLSGYLPAALGAPPAERTLGGRPFFVAHGTLDPMLPVEMGRAARDYLIAHGADLTYREYQMAHQVVYEELTDLAAWLAPRLDAVG